MEYSEYIPALEAILFASGEGVSVSRLALALEIEEKTVISAIEKLSKLLKSENSGVEVIKIGDAYQMTTKACYNNVIRKVFELKRNTPLSQAAFEVLSVVAYNQPVTRAYIDQVRGVDCSGVVGSLSQKGLIEECGRLDLPGRPLLYRTTENFLRCFSLSSLSDLPPIPSPVQDGEQTEMELSDTGNAQDNQNNENSLHESRSDDGQE